MPTFVGDWLADGLVSAMEADEEGTYWRLLTIAWREYGLDPDLDEVRAMTKIRTDEDWARVWRRVGRKLRADIPCGCLLSPCPHGDGRFRDKRQEKERRSLLEFRELQSERGKAGASARWNGAAMPPPCSGIASALPGDGSSSSIASALGGRAEEESRDELSPQTETSSPDGDERARHLISLARWREEFAQLWKAHPPRRGTKANKPKAWEAYRALRPSPELAAEIFAGHARAVLSQTWLDGFVPDLHRWLRAKGWDDEQGIAAAGWKDRFLARGDGDE